MTKEKFNKLSLEKRMEIYNQWLVDSKLTEYTLYINDNDGIEALFLDNFSQMANDLDIVNELTNSIHYDITDKLITYDRDIPFGFRSLTDLDIKERFENQDFLDYLDGVTDYD